MHQNGKKIGVPSIVNDDNVPETYRSNAKRLKHTCQIVPLSHRERTTATIVYNFHPSYQHIDSFVQNFMDENGKSVLLAL